MDNDYEDLTECGLSEELEGKLLNTQRECVFMWTNQLGEAFGVVHAYLPKDGKIWMTAAERRKRITAIRRFPRASVCINGTGTAIGGGKTVTYKGDCVVHDDRETKDWFYPSTSIPATSRRPACFVPSWIHPIGSSSSSPPTTS